jgi:hypothetical protein
MHKIQNATFIQAYDIALNNYDFDTIVAGLLEGGNQSGRGGAEGICLGPGKGSRQRKSKCYLQQYCKPGRKFW